MTAGLANKPAGRQAGRHAGMQAEQGDGQANVSFAFDRWLQHSKRNGRAGRRASAPLPSSVLSIMEVLWILLPR